MRLTRLLLMSSLMVMLALPGLKGQCPGCVPVNCSATNPDGGLCDTILVAMVNHPMDEQVSFYMPSLFFTNLVPGGGVVRLNRIQIQGVVGLPVGLDWESDRSGSGNQYYPQSGDTIGCVRICGTPITPVSQVDTIFLTVNLVADVTAVSLGITVNNQAQTYSNARIVLFPDSSGGVSSFSFLPAINTSCDDLTLSFQALIDGDPNPTSWFWDFGNGNTATGVMPGSQTYDTIGQYPATLTTIIDDYVITNFSISGVNNSWAGDIEEWTTIGFNPDLYFTIPTIGYTSSIKVGTSATWTGLSIHLPQGKTQIAIEIWDKDNGPPLGSPDDFLGLALIDISGGGGGAWQDTNGTSTNGLIIISTDIGTVITETLDITIGNPPDLSPVTVSQTEFCFGDSSILVIPGGSSFFLQWYKDTLPIPGATDAVLIAKQTGNYSVKATNSLGCETFSNEVAIMANPFPPAPQIQYLVANNQLVAANGAGFDIQWYRNGTPIPGANGLFLDIDSKDGAFSVRLGTGECTTTSAPFSFTSSGQLIESRDVFVGVYPNPNEGIFTIELNNDLAENISLSVVNSIGQVVFQDNIQQQGTVRKVIDLQRYPKGLYLCQISTSAYADSKPILIY